jgi:hypothetical protein
MPPTRNLGNSGPECCTAPDNRRFGRAESDGEGATIIPLPTGYATCEAAGFITSDIGACIITPVLSGTLTGDVVLSLSDIPPKTGEFSTMFDLRGPVEFSISPDLARAGGVSAGPYFGSLTVEGLYFQDTSLDGQPEYRMFYSLFEVSGATVPEPSAFISLFTAIVIVCGALRQRQSRSAKIRNRIYQN